jgi:hypothetical protein
VRISYVNGGEQRIRQKMMGGGEQTVKSEGG